MAKIPAPKPGENRAEYIGRMTRDEQVKRDFPRPSHRQQAIFNAWRHRGNNE